MDEIDARKASWEDEFPMFRPRCPFLFPCIIFWVSVAEGIVAGAALAGDCWGRWLDVTFGSLPESHHEEKTA